MIEVRKLTKRYGDLTAIHDVTFDVEKGEILGFLGPNAAGKTTTMRILTCFMPATAGTARVAGYDIFQQSLEVRKRVGYLPENAPLYLDMRVKPYLEFVAKIKGIDPRDREKRIRRVMGICAIEHVGQQIIGHLSKGYRQRVGLAQALVHDPPVLIFDEPTNGLDPKQIIEVRELIKSLAGDHTIILSSHILPEVSMTCQRVVIINKGTVVAMDTPQNLNTKLKGSQTVTLQVRGPVKEVMAALKEVDGVLEVRTRNSDRDSIWRYEVESRPGQDIREQLAAKIVRGNWGLVELATVGMSLEEIFLQLTTEEEGVQA